MEPALEEVLQECKVDRAEQRTVLKEFAGHQPCERQSQKALLIMSARCQQLEQELATAHTKVCGDTTVPSYYLKGAKLVVTCIFGVCAGDVVS